MKREKVKEFIEKAKEFSLLGYLLDRKIRKFEFDMDLNEGLIEIYKTEIDNWTIEIEKNKFVIEELIIKNKELSRKIRDIKKVSN